MKFLTAGMKELTTDEEKVAARLKMLMLGFRKVRGNNDKYAYTFCLLEVVNFVNVILQVIFISTISTLYLYISCRSTSRTCSSTASSWTTARGCSATTR